MTATYRDLAQDLRTVAAALDELPADLPLPTYASLDIQPHPFIGEEPTRAMVDALNRALFAAAGGVGEPEPIEPAEPAEPDNLPGRTHYTGRAHRIGHMISVRVYGGWDKA